MMINHDKTSRSSTVRVPNFQIKPSLKKKCMLTNALPTWTNRRFGGLQFTEMRTVLCLMVHSLVFLSTGSSLKCLQMFAASPYGARIQILVAEAAPDVSKIPGWCCIGRCSTTLSSVQNPCCLMIVGDYTTQHIGECNNPMGECFRNQPVWWNDRVILNTAH